MSARRAGVVALSRCGAAVLLAACVRTPEPQPEAQPSPQPATHAAAQPPAQAAAPAGPPGTDIWIAPITTTGSSIALGTPQNVTGTRGYDNQPAFEADGRTLLYTSIRSLPQAEIYRWDPAMGLSVPVTLTPAESEYSPTLTPDGGISVVRVERDSTQRLWRMSGGGTDFRVVLERVKPVGYHAWADDTTLALFVLGSPPTLQLASTRTGDARVVDDSIGRSIHRIPGARAVSYTRRGADGVRWLMRLDVATGAKTRLLRMPEGVEDHAWMPSGTALAARGTELLAWRPGTGDWATVGTFSAPGLGRITRLAVSPDGRQLAFVAEESEN